MDYLLHSQKALKRWCGRCNWLFWYLVRYNIALFISVQYSEVNYMVVPPKCSQYIIGLGVFSVAQDPLVLIPGPAAGARPGSIVPLLLPGCLGLYFIVAWLPWPVLYCGQLPWPVFYSGLAALACTLLWPAVLACTVKWPAALACTVCWAGCHGLYCMLGWLPWPVLNSGLAPLACTVYYGGLAAITAGTIHWVFSQSTLACTRAIPKTLKKSHTSRSVNSGHNYIHFIWCNRYTLEGVTYFPYRELDIL